jgi:ABC-type Fe3+-hydroxamate transport system substrate-binding protein
VELSPDLVLMNEEENRREDALALERAGLRCLTTFPRDVAGAAAMVREIGAALDRGERAEEIARDIETRAERAQSAARGRPSVRFAYVIWRKPWMSVNADTYASNLLELPGGANVFGRRAERYPEFTPRELADAAPDLVLLCTEPFPFREKHADELAREAGLARDRFVIADGELLSWHGSRPPAGIDYAVRCLTLFPTV